MKRKMTMVSLLLLSLNTQASANGWQELGGILKQACGTVKNGTGTFGGVNIPISGQTGEKLKWLCQLNNIHGFVNENILNGDWEGFAKDVAGQYLGRLVDSAAGQLGDTSRINDGLSQLNAAMNKDYATFRSAIYGAALNNMRNSLLLNAGAAPGSVGDLTNQAIEANPSLALADQIAATADALDAVQGADKAYKAKKIQDEAKKAIEANLAQGMSNATEVIGTPTSQGIVDKYSAQAQTAVSTREQVEILTNLTGEAMKSKVTSDIAILNQLSEMVQQQVMTNNQLMLQRNNAEQEIASRRQQMTAMIEEQTAASRQQYAQNVSEITSAYDGLANFLDRKIELKSVGE